MTATDLRDAIVRQLVQPAEPGGEPQAHLANIDAAGAALLLPQWGVPLILLVWPGDEAVEELQERVHRVMETARPGVTHLALVGGGERARALARELQPFWQLDRRLALHQIDESGEVWDIGAKLPPLTEAAPRAVAAPFTPLTHDELLSWRERTREQMQAEQGFVRDLRRRQPLATYAIIAANVVLFALEMLWNAPDSGRTLLRMGALARPEVEHGEWWRLLSAAFLHGSVLHVAVNCWSLYALGPFVERLFGSARFLVLYGLAAITGSIASAAFSGALSVGASGAIFGVFGALIALALGKQGPLPAAYRANLKRSLFAPIAINVVISFQSGVDKFAHFGGLAMGTIVALVFSRTVLSGDGEREARRYRNPSGFTRIAAAAMAVLMAFSVGSALAHGRPWSAEELPAFERVQLDGSDLSLELPHGLERVKDTAEDDASLWKIGDLDRDGLLVRLAIVPLPEAPPAEEERKIVAEHKRLLQEGKLPPGSRDVQVSEATQDGHPVASRSFVQSDGIRRHHWFFLRGAHLVSVEAALVPEAPVTWEQALERIPRSVEAGTAAAASSAPR